MCDEEPARMPDDSEFQSECGATTLKPREANCGGPDEPSWPCKVIVISKQLSK